jgi:hypothetical protein
MRQSKSVARQAWLPIGPVRASHTVRRLPDRHVCCASLKGLDDANRRVILTACI